MSGMVSVVLFRPGEENELVDRLTVLRYDSRMIAAVSSQTMSQIDANAQRDYAIPGIALMEQAGLRAWNHIAASLSGKEHKLVFLAGGGNNGGDALVMARQAFNDGWRNCTCVFCGTHLSPSCITQRAICRNLGLAIIDTSAGATGQTGLNASNSRLDIVIQALNDADLIVDGIAGTGLRGPLAGISAQLVEILNERADQGVPIVSVDIPSGVSDDVSVAAPVVRACATIAMGLPKASCYHPVIRACSGDIITVNPSFPPQLLEKAPPMAQVFTYEDCVLQARKPTDYKNTRGHVAIFGGSAGYTGAPRLAARGAFHARCGLVTLFADRETYPILATENPSVIVRQLPEASATAPFRNATDLTFQDLKDYQAVLAGPGWGAGREDLLRILLDSRLPLVLDADGIRAYASLIKQDPLVLKGHGPLLLTPHPGELRIIVQAVLGEAAAQAIGRTDTPAMYLALLQELSRRTEAVILAKGHVNWIVGSEPWQAANPKAAIVDSRTCELGVAGSGDVLAGICAALLGQDVSSPFKAALDGALVHLEAGKLATRKQGWFSSEELIEQVGVAIDGRTGRADANSPDRNNPDGGRPNATGVDGNGTMVSLAGGPA
jgi:NAD(P)H-hydrate epimerase